MKFPARVIMMAALFTGLSIGMGAQAQRTGTPAPTQAPVQAVPAPPAAPQIAPLLPPPPQAAPVLTLPAAPGAPPAAATRVRNTPTVSCADWFTACRRRGDTVASCTEKRDACIATTGCFTEPARFGGETFCQLQRR